MNASTTWARTSRGLSILTAGAAVLAAVAGMGIMLGLADHDKNKDKDKDKDRDKCGRYTQRNLVSDGFVTAEHRDANVVNAWGIVPNPTGFWWVSDNGTGVSTLYDQNGVAQSLVVSIPSPASAGMGKVTGIVFSGSSDFVVNDGAGGHSGPARFIFSTEDGIIAGWAPAVPPPAPSTQAQIAVNNSAFGSVYKGLAIGESTSHKPRLYAADFHNASVDVFDGSFAAVHVAGAFEDNGLPSGFAPFGIQNIGGKIFVTFAKQDADAHDNVNGHGLGFVDVFDGDGTLLKRFASRGKLNAPWGLALAPSNFGRFSGDVLIGNFGNGRINAFNAKTGKFRGTLRGAHGRKIEIEGLWGLAFGNGAQAGPTNTLFFAAGPDEEMHGLFGRLDPGACKGDDDDDEGDHDG